MHTGKAQSWVSISANTHCDREGNLDNNMETLNGGENWMMRCLVMILIPGWILQECNHCLGTSLEERVASDNLQESLQSFPPRFNHFIRESVGEYLAWQGRNIDSCTFSLQDVSEGFEIRVASPDRRVFNFESWDVRTAHDLVVCVHFASKIMCSWISDLNF